MKDVHVKIDKFGLGLLRCAGYNRGVKIVNLTTTF